MSSLSSLSRTATSTQSAVTFRPILPFLYPHLHRNSTEAENGRARHRCRPTPSRDSGKKEQRRLDNGFITALVRASSCQTHSGTRLARNDTTRHLSSQPRERNQLRSSGGRPLSRRYYTGQKRSAAEPQRSDITRQQLTELVDLYPIHGSLDGWEEDVFAEDRTPPRTGNLKLPEQEGEDREEKESDWPDIILPKDSVSSGKLYTGDEGLAMQEHAAVARLSALLDVPRTDHTAIFEAYQELPFPRISYLTEPAIRQLLAKMAITKRNDEGHVLRYLSILDDMKVADVPANVAEWSTAIKMAGQTFKLVTGADVESALYIWRDMERRAGVQSTEVTFNILFEVAAKAGKSPLVELIMQEMESRKLPKTRFFRLISIFYYGVVGDGNSVRKAYREFVAAGEIVDTSVLNAVIVSLYRCGETAAAESIFERMKHMQLSPQTRTEPPRDWLRQRQYWRWLESQAKRVKHDAEARRSLQASAPLAPDSRTYRIMLAWAAVQAGDWRRVKVLREEMRARQLDMSWKHYRHLFEAFSKHGPGLRRRITDWTESRLQRVWDEYLESLGDDPVEYAFSRRSAQIILHAWWMTCGREKMRRHWGVLRSRWKDAKEEDLKAISAWVRDRFPDEGWEPATNLQSRLFNP